MNVNYIEECAIGELHVVKCVISFNLHNIIIIFYYYNVRVAKIRLVGGNGVNGFSQPISVG